MKKLFLLTLLNLVTLLHAADSLERQFKKIKLEEYPEYIYFYDLGPDLEKGEVKIDESIPVKTKDFFSNMDNSYLKNDIIYYKVHFSNPKECALEIDNFNIFENPTKQLIARLETGLCASILLARTFKLSDVPDIEEFTIDTVHLITQKELFARYLSESENE